MVGHSKEWSVEGEGEMKGIKFKAILSGDCECFVFAVTKTTYKQITDKNPDIYAKNRFGKGLYNIYPDDIFGIGRNKDFISIKIEWGI